MYNKDNVCKFCNKSFHTEKTLSIHQCPKKRRNADKDTLESRLAFTAYQTFYQMTTNLKTPKTFEDFIGCQFYLDFYKFGKFMAQTKPIDPNEFVKFLINESIPLQYWRNDEVYETYLRILLHKEPAERALERTFTTMLEWCKLNGCQFEDFFSTVGPYEAAWLIKTGKLSPWLLYLCTGAGSLLSRLNTEHAVMLKEIMDVNFWKNKFVKNADDVAYVEEVLEGSGLQ